MTARDIERSLTASAHGALVTIADIAAWSGRSREYLKHNILNGIECIQEGTSKFYFAGDVAKAIVNKAN